MKFVAKGTIANKFNERRRAVYALAIIITDDGQVPWGTMASLNQTKLINIQQLT